MKRILAGALGAVALASTTMLTAMPASAALTTRCVGEGGAVTVPGDLVVPSGQTCLLSGTTVAGDVRVAQGADLIASEATFEGRVVGAADAYVELTDSSVAGEVRLVDAFGGLIERSEVSERVLVRENSSDYTFALVLESDLGADLVARGGEVFVDQSQITGSVNSRDSRYTDVYASFVDGDVRVQTASAGSLLCQASVQGAAVLRDNAGTVQIGADGPGFPCEGGSYVGGNVVAEGNTGGVYVDNVIINGRLRVAENDPAAVIGDGVMARGGIVGESTEEAAVSLMERSGRSAGPAQSRDQALQERVAERQGEARAEAEQAGAADLG
ncbi:hypothetical protein LQF12_04700 [Ruania suaedae]|uniref:hypothetical protein n=1 Tax=Ruania suaedae TaxID=2897774 RepID=UPI001E4E9ACD|nr:hypothetical protein [Ruania suaedae]UFU03913.1 hypothetical protein LQF12_04700 [Ruania suaedae]